MTSDLPASYSQMLQLPLHKIDHAAPGGSATGGGSNADPSNTPRRSLSQSLLAQMSGPAFGMSRSPSPSPLLNSLRRGPRSGFGSHGPSLQSLVQSFVNKVSRGTQTDCDDNFDQVSIASAATGFSVMASDLTRNRIKMFLNDRTMAANDVDVNEFAEELHKLRYQIDGRFNDFEDNQSVQFDDNDFEHEVKFRTANSLHSSTIALPRGGGDKFRTVVETRHAATETEPLPTQHCSTQTEPTQTETESSPPEVESSPPITTTTTSNSVQTDPDLATEECPESCSAMVESKPELHEIETQTDLFQFCQHCLGSETVRRDLLLRQQQLLQQNGDLLLEPAAVGTVDQDHQKSPQHQYNHQYQDHQYQHSAAPVSVFKYEFIISNANIICRDDKFGQDQIKNNHHQPGHGPVTNFQLNNGSLSQIVEHQQMAAPVPGKAIPSRTGSQKKTNGTANAKTETSPSSSSSSPPAKAAESAPCKAKSAPKLTGSSYDTDYGITEHIQQNRKPGSATRGRSTPASPISSSNGKSTLNTTTTTTASSPAKSPKKSSTKKHIIAGADDDPNKTTLLLADTKADPKCCSIT